MSRVLSHQRNPLGRTVRLLGWMADHEADDYGVRELAAAVGMAPSTVHRSLGALEEEGLVESLPATGRYRLSLGFYRLALRGAARAPVVDLALPFLRSAADTGGETALLALYGQAELATMYVAEIPARHPLQVRPALHEWMPLTTCAAGLAILSLLDGRTLISAFGRELGQVNASDLAGQLAIVRERGFASLPARPGNFAREVAAAFLGPSGQVLGAVAFAVPERRFNPVLEGSLGQLLVEQARAISAALAG
ncbi:MAG TPA: helix-turn-helix domain-containing protein [Candidatus Dormibacteraeota bacterium]